MALLLEVLDVIKRFPVKVHGKRKQLHAVDGLNFHIEAGEQVIGEQGLVVAEPAPPRGAQEPQLRVKYLHAGNLCQMGRGHMLALHVRPDAVPR